jgi:dGTPase
LGRRHGKNVAVNAGRPQAPFAADPAAGRGRLYKEPPSATRNDFRRDCDRIIHCTAFRRLAHKTQVFIYHEGDHYRTRLTHTLEVTQIARSLARALDLNEDLAEACALAHDLGHPPFGHSGERALDQCLALHGGFDHNAQTLSVVTRLERRYAAFDGLNLTYETLEGLVKHNGPLTDASGRAMCHHATHGVAQAILDYNAVQDLKLALHPSAEAQAGAIADDIAYDAHDIDDGLRARMFAIDELAALPLIADILAEIERGSRLPPSPPALSSSACGGGKSGSKPSVPLPRLGGTEGWGPGEGGLEPVRRAHELVRRLIARMIEDVISHSKHLIAERAPASVEDIRRAGMPVVAFSPAMAAADRAIKAFLFPRVYRHPRIVRIMSDAQSVVTDLFTRYMGDGRDLPVRDAPAEALTGARQIADFIAGMTDRYALSEHARLFDSTPELR